MKNLFKVVATVAVATLASGTLITGLAGTAHAAGNPPWEPLSSPPEVGGLTFYNAAGQQITGGSTTVSPLAAYVEGSNTVRSGDTVATLDGYTPVDGVPAGQWSGEQLSGSTTFPNASAPAPLKTSALPVVTGSSSDEDLADYQSDFPNTDTSGDGYAGLYVLRLYTGASGKAGTTSYDAADIQITGTTWSVVYPAVTLTSTTTTLTATPSSPQPSGTSVTLNATVSPSAPGTVQFEDGSTDIGSPVTVTGGTASTSTTALPVGNDTLNAVFTPSQFAAYSGSTGSKSYTVTAATFHISTTSLPDAVVGTPYSQQLATADGGSGTVKWKKVSLPKGFKLSSTGLLTGTPSAKATGPFSVDVSASLNKATPVTADIPLTVEEAPAFNAKAALATSFQDGTSSSFTIVATGYPAPSISKSGSLPSGVTFSDGVLSGTPATVANTVSYPLTITATNGVGTTATESFTLTAIAPLVITTNSLPAATPGAAYGPVNFAATGGEAAYTWKKVGTLPKGLTLSSTGALSGTLSTRVASGPASVSVEVESKEGKTKVITQATLTLNVG